MTLDLKILYLCLGIAALSSCKSRNASKLNSESKVSVDARDPAARLTYDSRWLMEWPDDSKWKTKWEAWAKEKKITGTNIKIEKLPRDATGKENFGARSIWYNTSQGSYFAPAAIFLALKKSDNTPFASPENLIRYGFIYPPAEGDERGFKREDFLKSSEYSYLGLPLGLTPDVSLRDGVVGAVSIGPTCATCHTSEMVTEVNGKKTRVVVDGGQPLLDFVGFMTDFSEDLSRVAKETKETQALCEDVKRIESELIKPDKPVYQNAITCAEHLQATVTYLTSRLKRNREAVKSGPGRLDALGNLVNELLVYHLGFEDSQAIQPSAPVSFPYLWSAADMECVQTNCLTSDPLTRNLGEVSGVFGLIKVGVSSNSLKIDKSQEEPSKVNLPQEAMNAVNAIAKTFNNPDPFPRVRASSNPTVMFILEDALKTLPSPKWSSLFSVDSELAAKGKELYERKEFAVKINGSETAEKQSCATCHVYLDNRTGDSFADPSMSASPNVKFIKSPKLRQADVGTDNAFLAQASGKSVPTDKLPMSVQLAYKLLIGQTVSGKLATQFREFKENPFSLLGQLTREKVANTPNLQERLANMPALAAFGIINRFSVEGWAAEQGLIKSDTDVLSHHHASVRPLDANVYKSRPLNGISFSAPYLHNGSVPSLSAFFEVERPRPATFSVNSVRYDQTNIGYINEASFSEDNVNSFTFDTNVEGNKNVGHPWGTAWTKEDKVALIEFLKTL